MVGARTYLILSGDSAAILKMAIWIFQRAQFFPYAEDRGARQRRWRHASLLCLSQPAVTHEGAVTYHSNEYYFKGTEHPT